MQVSRDCTLTWTLTKSPSVQLPFWCMNRVYNIATRICLDKIVMLFLSTRCNRLHTLVSCQHAQHTMCSLHNVYLTSFKQNSNSSHISLANTRSGICSPSSNPYQTSFLHLLCTTDSHTLILQWVWGHLLPHWSSGWIWLIWMARRVLPSLLSASMCIPPKTVHSVKECTKYFYSQNKEEPVFSQRYRSSCTPLLEPPNKLSRST